MEDKIISYINDNLDLGEVTSKPIFPKQGMSGSVFFIVTKKAGELVVKYGNNVNKDYDLLKLVNENLLDFPTPKIFANFDLAGKHVLILEKIKGISFGEISLEFLPEYYNTVIVTLKNLHKIKREGIDWKDYLLKIFIDGNLDWEEIVNRKNLNKDLVLKVREILLNNIKNTDLNLGEYSLLHTDFNQSNIFVDEKSCKITGVIDWEEATFGDPVYDFARFHLHLWHRGVSDPEIKNFLNMLEFNDAEKARELLYFNIFLLHYLAYYSEQDDEFCIGRIKMHQDYLKSNIE